MREIESLEKSTPDRIREVLAEHHLTGESLSSILSREDTVSSATFYRWKAESPGEFASLEKAAMSQASDYLLSNLDVASLRESAELQREATRALLMAIPKLAEIATGQGWADERAEHEGNINIYPRDVIEAARMLHVIAKEGIVPGTLQYTRMLERQGGGPPQDRPQLLPVISAGRDFRSLRATKADGTEISVEVKDPDMLIE